MTGDYKRYALPSVPANQPLFLCHATHPFRTVASSSPSSSPRSLLMPGQTNPGYAWAGQGVWVAQLNRAHSCVFVLTAKSPELLGLPRQGMARRTRHHAAVHAGHCRVCAAGRGPRIPRPFPPMAHLRSHPGVPQLPFDHAGTSARPVPVHTGGLHLHGPGGQSCHACVPRDRNIRPAPQPPEGRELLLHQAG